MLLHFLRMSWTSITDKILSCFLLFSSNARYELVGDVRGMGLVQAVEIVSSKLSKSPVPRLATQVQDESSGLFYVQDPALFDRLSRQRPIQKLAEIYIFLN